MRIAFLVKQNLSLAELSRLGRAPTSLLKRRVGDISLPLEESWIWPLIEEMKDELARQKFHFQPHFWTSVEWFCPDGVPGIAVPFSILSPQIASIEKRVIGQVDGSGPEGCRRILRHELGHAIDNAFRLRSHPLRKAIFGTSRKPYPKSYQPMLYSSRYVRHLGMGYAQSHPDEDFAETFAVWFNPSSEWRRRYRETPALKKLQAMDTLMKEIRLQEPLLKNRRRVEPIEKCDWTLAHYLNWKWRQSGQHRWRRWDTVLRGLGFGMRGKVRADFILRRHSHDFARELALTSGLPIYRAGMVVRALSLRAQQLELFASDLSKSPHSRARNLAAQARNLLVPDSFRLYL